MLDVLGLVVRRQALLWMSWRPWLAAIGLALPSSLLLMGFSLSVSLTFLRLIDPQISRPEGWTAGLGLAQLTLHALLLIGWSWTGGFAVGSLSPRTLWASLVSCCVACSFCLVRFHLESLSRFCLLLFLLPAILGARQGLRVARVRMGSAVAVALVVTALMIPNGSSRGQRWWSPPALLSWTLILPAWYIVATARKPGKGN